MREVRRTQDQVLLRSNMLCSFHNILLSWSNQKRWNVWRSEMFRGVRFEIRKGRYHFGNPGV